MDIGVRDHVFVVGGGTQGLGLATATELVREGAKVLVVSRSQENVEAAVEALGVESAAGLAADLSDPAAPAQAVSAALARFGRLDGALVNTGGPPPAPVEQLDDELWEDATRSTLIGPVRLARHVITHLTGTDGTGGSLVFVLSTSARNPLRGLALSNALRPGVAMHVKDLADAYGGGERPVRVNALLPGSFRTSRAGVGPFDTTGVPLGRIGQPAEFGRVAAFVLSPAASYLTGSLVPVDGGRLRSL